MKTTEIKTIKVNDATTNEFLGKIGVVGLDLDFRYRLGSFPYGILPATALPQVALSFLGISSTDLIYCEETDETAIPGITFGCE